MIVRGLAGISVQRGGSLRGRILEAAQAIPAGHITTFDAIALHLGLSPAQILTVLAQLTEDERQTTPWQRVVAKGGAIGRGPWRERQFALLVREGIAVSPAGIVQDMARVAIVDLTAQRPLRGEQPPAAALKGRSRGMKDRPGP